MSIKPTHSETLSLLKQILEITEEHGGMRPPTFVIYTIKQAVSKHLNLFKPDVDPGQLSLFSQEYLNRLDDSRT